MYIFHWKWYGIQDSSRPTVHSGGPNLTSASEPSKRSLEKPLEWGPTESKIRPKSMAQSEKRHHPFCGFTVSLRATLLATWGSASTAASSNDFRQSEAESLFVCLSIISYPFVRQACLGNSYAGSADLLASLSKYLSIRPPTCFPVSLAGYLSSLLIHPSTVSLSLSLSINLLA